MGDQNDIRLYFRRYPVRIDHDRLSIILDLQGCLAVPGEFFQCFHDLCI